MTKTTPQPNGKRGGYLVGRRHATGGIKAVNADSDAPLELETDEVVITRRAVLSPRKHDFDGRPMTNLEILSSINQEGGGVALYAKGGIVEETVAVRCSPSRHQYDQCSLTGKEITQRILAETNEQTAIYERQLAGLQAALSFSHGAQREALRRQLELLQLTYKMNLYG